MYMLYIDIIHNNSATVRDYYNEYYRYSTKYGPNGATTPSCSHFSKWTHHVWSAVCWTEIQRT